MFLRVTLMFALFFFARSSVPQVQKFRVRSAWNPELSKMPSVKHGAGHHAALHTSPTARTFAVLISAFLVDSVSYFPSFLSI